MMRIKVLTLFPEMFEGILSSSILGRAIREEKLKVEIINIRAYAANKHSNADDTPFGGGAGMVMLAQPIVDAIEGNRGAGARCVYMSPRGKRFTQRVAEEYAGLNELILLCGHYEGVDQRAIDMCVDEELSLGDYVLTGGELGAMVVVDAVSRLLPGVLGCAQSGEDESFTTGLLEYPQYTRPAEFRGANVPEVLLNGNHADIVLWRRAQALAVTSDRRPDLLENAPLTKEDKVMLEKHEYAREWLKKLAQIHVKGARLDIILEREYKRDWITRFVKAEMRKEARKRCVSGRRHVGYLAQAFEYGLIESVDNARELLEQTSGAAVLYDDKRDVALLIEDCASITSLDMHMVLTTAEYTFANSGKGVLYCAK